MRFLHFQVLRFGSLSLAALQDGTILLTFWCYEEYVSVIRWYKLAAD